MKWNVQSMKCGCNAAHFVRLLPLNYVFDSLLRWDLNISLPFFFAKANLTFQPYKFSENSECQQSVEPPLWTIFWWSFWETAKIIPFLLNEINVENKDLNADISPCEGLLLALDLDEDTRSIKWCEPHTTLHSLRYVHFMTFFFVF